MTAIEQAGAAGQHANIEWAETGAPVSIDFDDPYYSLADGLAESEHVYFAANDLPRRLRTGFRIAELGFGTGLNLAILAGMASVPVTFTSFEAFPMSGEDAMRALRTIGGSTLNPDHIELIGAALEAGKNRFQVGQVAVELIVGDARQTLANWDRVADAWFLDGFAPSKNPEMWEADLLEQVGAHSREGTTFATFTAAGAVRRALDDAGFTVERIPGFGRKRHMSRGQFTPNKGLPA